MNPIRSAVIVRQLAEKSEWAVNATEEVLLSIPHCTPARPSGIQPGLFDCTLSFDDGSGFSIPVPPFIRPFLRKAPTVLVVAFRRTNIISEIDVFVQHGETEMGAEANA